jgi:glycosyltransferase involved in cell wall biosynthesis
MAAFVIAGAVPSLKHAMVWKPHVLHVHFAVPTGVVGWLVRRITGIPYVLSAHLGDVPGAMPEQTGHLFRFIKPFTVPIWKDASAVTAPSVHIGLLAVEAYGVHPEILANGMDLAVLKQSPENGHVPVRLVFAGRFDAQKNSLFMIEVLERIRDLQWRMDLLGDGPLMERMKDKVRGAGLEERVCFHGWVSPDRVESVMSESDVLLLPSLSEGMPVVGARALGVGLAIVGSNVGGIDDLVRNGENGLLCPVNDTDAFEKALRRVLTSKGLLADTKKASRKRAGELDLKAIVDRYEQLLETAAQQETLSHERHERLLQCK